MVGVPTKESDGPLAFFSLEDDWDEVEIPMDTCPVGQVSSCTDQPIPALTLYSPMKRQIFKT